MNSVVQWSLNIFFIFYGMAFFTMGIVILLQPKKGSAFKLANILWLLACFGLIQGINEWLNMWVINEHQSRILDLVKLSCLIISFIFLFEFVKRLLTASFYERISQRQKEIARFFSWWIYLAGGMILLFSSISEYSDFWIEGGIWTRYLLGFPGALLTGIGFFSYYRHEERLLKEVRVKNYFLLNGSLFIIFGILSGLVVPKGDFFPSNWLNTDSFLSVMHMPVQALRGILAIITTITVAGMMRIFEWETKNKLELKMEKMTALNKELSQEIAMRERAEDSLRIALEESERRKTEIFELTEDLKRSNADLQQFAYAASHDLQEPLRGVAGFIKLLEKRYSDKLDEKGNEFMSYITDGIKRMEMLIKDLLEYSRLETKGKTLNRTNCSEILEQAIHNLRSAIEENGVQVTHDVLPMVMADSSQMSRLFQNLIGNAIKFRSHEPPKIHISAEQKGEEWIFCVKDNGIGIDPKNFERIFNIFQRLHTREEYDGTGIGLSICKKIVERHSGGIWVESEPGKGSTFYFSIPDRALPTRISTE